MGTLDAEYYLRHVKFFFFKFTQGFFFFNDLEIN